MKENRLFVKNIFSKIANFEGWHQKSGFFFQILKKTFLAFLNRFKIDFHTFSAACLIIIFKGILLQKLLFHHDFWKNQRFFMKNVLESSKCYLLKKMIQNFPNRHNLRKTILNRFGNATSIFFGNWKKNQDFWCQPSNFTIF